MKHVIIAGPGRSGKTDISMNLARRGFIHYKMDSIKRGLDNNFYDGFITFRDISPKMAHLIKTIIMEVETDIIKDIEHYVIDTCHLYPKDIVKENLQNTVIVFVGYPSISPEEKLFYVRSHDKVNQWTNSMSDEELLKWLKCGIEYSKEVERQCLELGIPFFDTGYDYDEVVEKVLRYIEDNIYDEKELKGVVKQKSKKDVRN